MVKQDIKHELKRKCRLNLWIEKFLTLFLRFFYSTSDHDLKNIDKSVEMSCYGAVILMSFPFASLRTAMYC